MKLTREQRTDVWKRKDALAQQLSLATSEQETERLKAKIEACNQELITEQYNPPALVDEVPPVDTKQIHPGSGTVQFP